MFLTGVLQAFGIIFVTSIGILVLRAVSVVHYIEPITYTIVAYITASLVLSLIAGPGKYAISSMKSKDSWIYAILLICLAVIQLFLVKYVSGTEYMLFNNVSIPISIFIAWVFLKRKQSLFNMVCLGILLCGLYIVFAIQKENVSTVIYLALSMGLFSSLMIFSAETHSQSKKANEEGYFRDKIRVVAFVSFILSLAFMVFALFVSFIKTYYLPETITNYIAFVPDINNFVDFPTVALGIIMGLLVIPVNRYLKWASAYNIKSENLLSILAFTPLVTMFFEWLLSFTNITSVKMISLDNSNLILLAVILNIIGAGLPIFVKSFNSYKDLKKKGLTFTEQFKQAKSFDRTGLVIKMEGYSQDYEIILATIQHCNGDFEKAADLLEIPLTTLQVVYDGEGEYVLKEGFSQLINTNFRERVVLSDSLTGLHNRTAMMSALEKLYKDKIGFALVFIDLNKFKQINDTYGHSAGDKALILVADKLNEFSSSECYAARFAGDEFCLLMPYSKSVSLGLVDGLKEALTTSFNYENQEINISASLGLAYSKDYATAHELLNSADEVMYKNKR